MSYFDAIILGILQGLTEFLPVSSSGHLVLAENILNAKMPGVLFELIVHFGTLMSVIIYFRKNIIALSKSITDRSKKEERKMILFLGVGTIPAVLMALFLKDQIESAFDSAVMTSVFLILTGLILLFAGLYQKGDRKINAGNALIVGIGQALAIFPGISRSGTSISFGLLAGVRPIIAAEFSFLLSIPAIIGAIIFKAREIAAIDFHILGQYLIGAILSFLSGLLAVYILLDFIRRGKFKYFGVYCIIIGLIGLVYFGNLV